MIQALGFMEAEQVVKILAFGTLWFWLLIIAASIVLFACTEFDRGFYATLTVVGSVIALHVWGGHTVLKYVVDHPGRSFGYAGIYLVLGTIWGVNKFWFFVRRQRRKYDEALERFKADFKNQGVVDTYRHRTTGSRDGYGNPKDIRTDDDIFKEAWKSVVRDGIYKDIVFEFKPDPKKHKRRILIWMTYWPWSFLWTILNDPFKAAYYWVLGLLKRISNRAFRDLGDPLMEGAEKK